MLFAQTQRTWLRQAFLKTGSTNRSDAAGFSSSRHDVRCILNSSPGEPSCMSSVDLPGIVQALFADDRGLLAMDESVGTCNKIFAEVGIAPTLENRHAYRDWIIRTPKLNEAIGGAILFDEAVRQTSADGKSFCQLATARPMRRGTSGSTHTLR